MAIFAASDALFGSGLDWQMIRNKLPPDQVAVYASSAMGQLDDAGFGGMMKAGSNGKRTSSKQCPLGFGEMPADFINAYILGSLGNTGTSMGACASFLYNLGHAVNDIRSGRARVVIVGNAEAPITPEVIEGYAAMGALATDEDLCALDGLPAGAVQSLTDFGQPGFGGACPPVGDKPHRYQFTLHALKVARLDLPASSMPALVGFMIHANEVASTRVTAYYGR